MACGKDLSRCRENRFVVEPVSESEWRTGSLDGCSRKDWCVYQPLVDDDAVDALIRRADGSVALVRIKARSQDAIPGDAALFAAFDHPKKRADYFGLCFIPREWMCGF